MALQPGGGKFYGKTLYSGRRRPMTRRSGYSVHDETTGGEFRRLAVSAYRLEKGQSLGLVFELPAAPGQLVGYGGWYSADQPIKIEIVGGPSLRVATQFESPLWNKFGSIWQLSSKTLTSVTIKMTALRDCSVAMYGAICGTIDHAHIRNARSVLLRNMYQFAPEAIFTDKEGTSRLTSSTALHSAGSIELVLKSCNRCGRYLPINIQDERCHLSFSNHCVAPVRCPCRHGTFSRLVNSQDSSDRLVLMHGYQLECRFCKKFEVNAAHNPQRTAAQMKEDAARRRAFEMLIEELEGGSPQLKYRQQTGRELTDDIYEKFGGKCFNCGQLLADRSWHLDHTRPLALLWPLDGTATALCGACNSEKRDRSPAEFYPQQQLVELAQITGIPLAHLLDPRPNLAIIKRLSQRLDWFFDEFLRSDDMTREHDGKIPGELLIKALIKALSHSRDRIAKYLIEEIMKWANRPTDV